MPGVSPRRACPQCAGTMWLWRIHPSALARRVDTYCFDCNACGLSHSEDVARDQPRHVP